MTLTSSWPEAGITESSFGISERASLKGTIQDAFLMSRFILGPLICGDGIDTDDKEILTASWTQEQQLQTWDLGTGKLFMTIDWNANLKTANDPVFLYAGQFSKKE